MLKKEADRRLSIEEIRKHSYVCMCVGGGRGGCEAGGDVCVWKEGAQWNASHRGVCFLCPRWFGYKHSRPLPMEIVRFPPYPDSEDHYRGTTVLPYLEVFYQYDTPEDRANIGK